MDRYARSRGTGPWLLWLLCTAQRWARPCACSAQVTAGLGAEDEVLSGGVEQVLIRASAGMMFPGGSESYAG